MHSQPRLLLLDTCGERASVALLQGDDPVAERVLGERAASAALQGVVREVVGMLPGGLRSLDGVGVVHGPGSFTGVRVGVAMAKGLCEAAELPVAAVSRLLVLGQAAALEEGFAVLEAGRWQVYSRRFGRDGSQPERMWIWEDFASQLPGLEIAVTSSRLAEAALRISDRVKLVELSARHALRAVRDCFAAGGSDLAMLDGNYVRPEDSIYRGSAVEPTRPRVG